MGFELSTWCMTDAPHVFLEQINEYVSGCIRVEIKREKN